MSAFLARWNDTLLHGFNVIYTLLLLIGIDSGTLCHYWTESLKLPATTGSHKICCIFELLLTGARSNVLLI